MRACIVGVMNLKHMTLMSLYTTYFEKRKIDYDIIYLDQYGIEETCGAKNIYKYDGVIKTSSTLMEKVQSRLVRYGFKKYTASILKNNGYDFVVVWREETAILISQFLKKYYKNKYAVNIRDIDICSGRRKKQNLKRLGNAVRDAAFNTVSSDGFIEYLPAANYLFLHSANDELLRNVFSRPRVYEKKGKIVISNVGTFRNDEYNYRLVDAFNNDDRFELRFIGHGSERMENYAKTMGYSNVICKGDFDPKETISLLEDADIINCAYGRDRIAETQKMPIRFYYAVYLQLPVLATEGTWIDKTAMNLEFGITVPEDLHVVNDLPNRIYRNYLDLNRTGYCANLADYRKAIEESHKELERLLSKSLSLRS